MAARGLAVLYGGAARARRALYRRGWCKVRRLPAPVVSVGNLTVGGTGKTPLVACLARELLNQGVKVAILSRGYGGRRKAVTCLSDGRQVFHKPPEVGEEAYWLARTLPGAIVYTGPCRYEAGLAAWREHRPDVFLLDDGFQHFQLHRDLDIVLLDDAAPFGNGKLLPAGPLREPQDALGEAQVLILTRTADSRLLHELKETYPDKVLLNATVKPLWAKRFTEHHDRGEEEAPVDLSDRVLFAFAGITRPRDFEKTLADLGVELKGFRYYPDHHVYTDADLSLLVDKAKESGARQLVTTSKDWARLGEKWEGDLPLWVFEVEASLVRSDILLERIQQTLAVARGSAGPTLAHSAPARGSAYSPVLQPLPREVRQRFRELRLAGGPLSGRADIRNILLRSPNWLGDAVMALYLPEPHTDFICSIMGEELGFIGVGVVIILFIILTYCGIKICLKAPDLFGTYLALGITALIALHATINLGVVMGRLPTKGSTLPFISYGGTSLVINLTSMGIMLNISSQPHLKTKL